MTCLVLFAGLVVGAGSGPATATSTILCRGYQGCADAGMGNDGYRQVSGTMFWRMYSGHNCTNYAAYRMVRSGLPNERPWTGSGNATNWGIARSDLTNQTPTVGAVAWWRANVRPAGSAGHVAYVEKVVSNDEIIVSQDSWGGDFSWARITRAGGSWPSGFVHFNDVTMTNLTKPAVSGLAKVGSRLHVTTGSWSPSDATLTYQWLSGGEPITGATRTSLKLKRPQKGKRVAVQVTAAKVGFPTAVVKTARTAKVAPGAMTSTAQPTITGTAAVDSVLTAHPGSWSPSPSGLAYQWSADGKPVKGATEATLTPVAGQVGQQLAVTVTASRDGYADVSAVSPATGPVASGTLAISQQPTVSGIPTLGELMTLHAPVFTPTDAQVDVQWLRGGDPVEGATGSTYPLSADDLGSRIGAQVTLTKPGYTPVTTTVEAPRRVRSEPVLNVSAKPGRGKVRIRVTVTAEGVSPVTGVVRFFRKGGLAAEVPLDGGVAVTTLTGLRSGTRSFKIRYPQRAKVNAGVIRGYTQIR